MLSAAHRGGPGEQSAHSLVDNGAETLPAHAQGGEKWRRKQNMSTPWIICFWQHMGLEQHGRELKGRLLCRYQLLFSPRMLCKANAAGNISPHIPNLPHSDSQATSAVEGQPLT